MSGELEPDRRGLRASHADRDQVVERLRVAAGDGRLTPEELDERLEAALTARTYGDLEALLSDLPPVPGTAAVPAVPTAKAGQPAQPAKDFVRLETHSGSIRRVGPWQVPRRLELETHSGSALIDLTQAVITEPTLDLAVSLRSGTIRLIVTPDIEVDLDGVVTHSGRVHDRVRRDPGLPVRLRVTITGKVRSGNVIVRGPRRTFWAWLRRRPAAARSADF